MTDELQATPAGPADSVGGRLLLIDDDQKLTRLLISFLGAEGFEVCAASDGAAGLHRARSERWDLIVLDVMLPRIDGFEVLRQLRQFSQTPVLMLTGRGTENDLVAGLDGGADDYLPKTSSARELSARIRALLRRAAIKALEQNTRSGAPQAELIVGALRLDAEARRVYVNGKEVELTPVEFALLASLARYKGRVRSREQLLQEVRERRFDVFDRSVDVHIASLRRKLGDDSRAARFIRTVRSAGYLLVEPDSELP
jgi:DNA-binding response OmpR family regulator